MDRPPEEVLDAGVGGNQPRLRNKTCATLHTAAHSPFVNLNRGCWLEPRVTERLNNSETIRHLEGGPANELENRHRHNRLRDQTGRMIMSGKAVLENVRRYRAIASLYRQTAAFGPSQRFSLLEQAKEWERLALAELESYFSTPRGSKYLCEQ